MPPQYKEARIDYNKWILGRHATTLRRFGYTDGTTWYLAHGPVEQATKKRAALGKRVWRMSNGKDGLWDDNISPSLYAKGQGKPIKISGFLANGRLEYWVLPAGYSEGRYKTTNMTGDRYNLLVESRFAAWRRACFGDVQDCRLVQDHEKCLWRDSLLTLCLSFGKR